MVSTQQPVLHINHRGGIGRRKGGLTGYRLRYCSMNHPDKGSQLCRVQIPADGIKCDLAHSQLDIKSCYVMDRLIHQRGGKHPN